MSDAVEDANAPADDLDGMRRAHRLPFAYPNKRREERHERQTAKAVLASGVSSPRRNPAFAPAQAPALHEFPAAGSTAVGSGE